MTMIETTTPLDELRDAFAVMDDWEDRYRYLIELGRKLPSFPEEARTEANKVRGCASQVWMVARMTDDSPAKLALLADSDAHIVKGLIAVLLMIFSGKTPAEIRAIDAKAILDELELAQHLSPMRTNGLFSMLGRIGELAAVA